MGKVIDLTGQKFGKLTVLYDTKIRKNRQVVWHCACDCGNESDVVGQALRSGHTKSCGCGNYESKNVEDITGKIFGDLTVLERNGSDESRRALWKCKCKCGNIRTVSTSYLKEGKNLFCQECQQSKEKINYNETKWYKEIANKKFGLLTPIEPTKDRNNAGRVIWKCKCDCGNPNYIFVLASSLKSGNTRSCGCIVGTSLGEEAIKEILINNNIEFKTQYTYEDLKSSKNAALRFDFAILNNGNVTRLIEYDGKQHFNAVEYWGGDEYLKYLQECDKIKNEYCIKNNIKLIRIPYTVKNITLDMLLGEEYAI